MDDRPVSRIEAAAADLVRRAYEAGRRDGRGDLERERALAHEAGVAAGKAAAERDHARILKEAVSAARKEASRARKAAPRKEWGSIRPVVYAAIAAAPGRTAQEIEAETGAKRVTVRAALADFVLLGYATKDEDGRFLAVDYERNLVGLRPKPRALKVAILAFVARSPGATTADVLANVDHKPTSVRSLLYQLRDAGELAGSGDGWSVPA